jgi:hypothetical protein
MGQSEPVGRPGQRASPDRMDRPVLRASQDLQGLMVSQAQRVLGGTLEARGRLDLQGSRGPLDLRGRKGRREPMGRWERPASQVLLALTDNRGVRGPRAKLGPPAQLDNLDHRARVGRRVLQARRGPRETLDLRGLSARQGLRDLPDQLVKQAPLVTLVQLASQAPLALQAISALPGPRAPSGALGRQALPETRATLDRRVCLETLGLWDRPGELGPQVTPVPRARMVRPDPSGLRGPLALQDSLGRQAPLAQLARTGSPDSRARTEQ